MAAKASNFPVEIEIENQNILKIEIELQEILQSLEHISDSQKSFDQSVLSARSKITYLKKTFSRFKDSVKEWEDHIEYAKNIAPLVANHKRMIQSLQSSFQKSCIFGQKRLTKLEKNILLSHAGETDITDDHKIRQRKQQKADVANKSADITENLVSIARMMDIQVKQGEDSNVILESSSQQIKVTHEEFKGLTGIISVSRKLLNKFNRREMTDTLLIFFGLILFFATVLYIISKRL